MRAFRAHLDGLDFIEVDPGAMQISPGNETHIHAIPLQYTAPNLTKQAYYLHTSPEFAMKKLLSAGEKRLYALGHVWRDREQGPTHLGEFTMLEFYRANEPYEMIMQDCADLIAIACQKTGLKQLNYKGLSADPLAPPQYITLAQAFDKYAQIDLLSLLQDRNKFAEKAHEKGIKTHENDTWSDIFSRVLVEKIEPHLGQNQLTFLTEYPASEAALARKKPSDPRVAERFELYACGVELANGFGELTDAEEQRARLTAEMDEKQRIYGTRHPLDEDFLQALAHMPQASGVALGFDRVVMLATGAHNIEQVIWTPLRSIP